jgi:hypothetical protein
MRLTQQFIVVNDTQFRFGREKQNSYVREVESNTVVVRRKLGVRPHRVSASIVCE